MAELAWPADLGHGTFIGRFGFMDADSHDEDREPDITSATGGTVTITPSIKSVRYSGVQGPMILAGRAAKGVIDAEGYLCTMNADGKAGDQGMVFPATDDTDLSPTDWTYSVSIVLDGSIRLPSFDVKLPEGSTVDLSVAVPVPPSGGTAIVVDPTTATRAEAAADRAETAATEAEDWAPSFVWDGTSLVIDGGDPVDLKGEQGTTAWADLTGKPATYPPTAHTHTITDVDGLQAALGKAPIARTFSSEYLLNGWVLTNANLPLTLARDGGLVTLEIPANTLDGSAATSDIFFTLPSGFRPAVTGNYTNLGFLSAGGTPTSLNRSASAVSSPARREIRGQSSWRTNDPWPTTLPGDPA